jgi:uncharacterized membrane protein (UPF0127 family)
MQVDGLPVTAKIGDVPLKLTALTTPNSQAKGYMGAEAQPKEDEGLLFIYDRPMPLSFWMKNVKFPLDIIFFDSDRKYLGHSSMAPHAGERDHELPRYSSKKPARFAVELCAGWCKKHLKPGATLDYLSEQRLLNEASIHSFNDDFLTDDYVKDIIASGELNHLLDWYASINNLGDTDGLEDSPEFISFIKKELQENLETAKENIYDKIDYDSNKIKLYRKITVDDRWLEHLKQQGKRLGIYWSWDESAAEAHWGDYSKGNAVTLEIEIDEKYVDWKTTFKLNMHPNFLEEKEIRLFKNTPIRLKSIEVNGKKVDVSKFNNKTFYA